MHCVTCNLPWHMVIDRTYVHGAKSQQTDSNAYSSWQGTQQWPTQWEQHGGRPKTPRQKSRPRTPKGQRTPRGGHGGQGGHPHQQQQMMPGAPMPGAAMAPLAPMNPMMGWGMQPMSMLPAPYPAGQFAPPLPPPETPWQPPAQGPHSALPVNPPLTPAMGAGLTMPAMPKMPSVPPPPEHVDSELMAMLRQDVAELPPHIQKAVKNSAMKDGVKDGAKATRNLHAAATHLGHMRKAYENAIFARSQLHSNWKKFLSDAVKLWQDYAVQFAAQEKKLSEQVSLTKAAFLEAKEASAKAHATAGEVHEISDEELGEVTSTTAGTAAKITESMEDLSKSLESLHQQAEAIVSEEEVHLAKRPRRKHPTEEDTAMEATDKEELGNSSKPFG